MSSNLRCTVYDEIDIFRALEDRTFKFGVQQEEVRSKPKISNSHSTLCSATNALMNLTLVNQSRWMAAKKSDIPDSITHGYQAVLMTQMQV